MMYYLISNLGATVIARINDNASMTFIPSVNGNSDWEAYQEWLAEGNEPLPWPPSE